MKGATVKKVILRFFLAVVPFVTPKNFTAVRGANQGDAHEDEIVQAGGSNEAISVRGRSLNLSIGPQQWRSLRTLTPTSIARVKIVCSLDMFIGGLRL